MRIQTKFSPNDKVAFDKDGQRMQGVIFSVVVTAFESDTILTYWVIHWDKIYMLKEGELTKIKNNGQKRITDMD